MSISRIRALLEYSHKITFDNFRDKIYLAWQKDSSSEEDWGGPESKKLDLKNPADAPVIDELVDEILKGIETADPSPKKEYVQWMVREYTKEHVIYEDLLSHCVEMLVKYNRMKNKKKLPSDLADINRLDYTQFVTEVGELEEEEEVKVDKGKSERLFNDSEVQIIRPIDKTAAIYYGRGTVWCTAATTSQNYWTTYTSGGKKLFIVLPKHPTFPREKYQLCNNGESKDDTNTTSFGWAVRFPQIIPFVRKNVPEVVGQLDRFLKNYEEASIVFDEAVAEGLAPEKEVLQKMFSLKGFKTAVFSTVFNCQGIIDALSLYVEGLPTHIPNTLRGITTLDKSLSEQTFKLEDLKRDCYVGFDQLNAMFHSPGVKAAVASDLALGSLYGKDIKKAIIRKIMEKPFFMKDKRGLREVLRAVWTAGEKIKWDR